MAQDHVNLVKLCVGAERVEDLARWQETARAKGPDGLPRHVTRMWPKRSGELLNGGSLYWVFKGVILARQRIMRLDEVTGGDGTRRCGIVLEARIIRTEAVVRRPFQGWRYLPAQDAPRDLPDRPRPAEEALPPGLMAALAEIGVR
ncbi:hypothetical protein EV663_1153 [Rhodovulum bhavnagarense]|uniref:DUF1489 family protein n=1 Tax=Rhodovulum bhavnagarense TaxID=992286 RepID=A0A4R2RAP3_9RHOB|nr:DUF1489 domain-containing protein [Rhodovulum bhavnagarense]TCP59793.1 hypothetical protein EV663_1153 [Rhodovulum bhavnagarense]